ncbi:MAG TPA: NAD(+)/NADH kinase [Myxococcota bacterium]
MRLVGIFAKPEQAEVGALVGELENWLEKRGVAVISETERVSWPEEPETARGDPAAQMDLAIVLGGDGTLLAVARALGRRPIPLLGVNLGTLGYLADTASDELYAALEQVLADGFAVESRMRLEVEVARDGAGLGRYLALNEAVIVRNAVSRLIDLETFADGMVVTTYHADGLIVATPTGSTAYSLSAGGPLLEPELEAILLTPISPHTLTHRPLVLPETCELEIRVQDARGGEVRLTVDGQVGCALKQGDRVCVRRSEFPVRMLVPPGRNRFEVMRTKLRWGER